MRLSPTVALLIAAFSLPAANAGRLCGSQKDQILAAAEEAAFSAFVALPQKRQEFRETVPLYWNVISRNDTIAGGEIPDEQVIDSVKVLNEAFSPAGVNFALVDIVRTRNEEWFLSVAPTSTLQTMMKRRLRQGEANALNIYTVGFEVVSQDDEGLLGYATFPSDVGLSPNDDGVVILYSSVPGGAKRNFNLGGTLVHETGHWLGLYHTFRGGCNDANGDYVSDTPPEREASEGCDIGRDTCPGNGPDPVENFMNYSFDRCLTHFTPGQYQRIQQQWAFYRAGA